MNTFLVDASAITLDLNWFKRTYLKAKLETGSSNGAIHQFMDITLGIS